VAGLTCERAAAILRGLEKNELVVAFEEIEEILALGLAVEADPDDIAMVAWLGNVVREFARCELNSPSAISGLEERLKETNEKLKSDWYRMTASKEERSGREDDRITLQRALGLLRDRVLVASLVKIVANSALLAPNVQYVACAQLGSEVYALTIKGYRVRRSLKVRLGRYGAATLKAFLASFEKIETKMKVFSGEIATLSQNIGFVKKNREQVVIGLAKTGKPAGHALGTYHTAIREVGHADVAVTCARNAEQFGGPSYVVARLRYAERLLLSAGYPNSPIVLGAAKSLLIFDPPEKGLPRFKELMHLLHPVLGRDEMVFKYAARLMSASGTPTEIVARVVAAGQSLQQIPSRVPTNPDLRATSVALASMVKNTEAIPALINRFRELEALLVESGLCLGQSVEGDALECIACPGEPAEVVDNVAILAEQVARGRPPARGDITIAVAFAKRFPF
jgi:hypothetical protein